MIQCPNRGFPSIHESSVRRESYNQWLDSHTHMEKDQANSNQRKHFWTKWTAPLRPERPKTPNYNVCLPQSDTQGEIYNQNKLLSPLLNSPTVLWFLHSNELVFPWSFHTYLSLFTCTFQLGTFQAIKRPIMTPRRPRTCKTVTVAH